MMCIYLSTTREAWSGDHSFVDFYTSTKVNHLTFFIIDV